MVDGPTGLLGRLTGDGDELDDLLGAKGGRGPRPLGIGEYLLDQAQQLRRGGLLLLSVVELGGRLQPAVAPVADREAGQAQVPGGGLDAGVGGQGQEDGGPPHQALVGRLPPHQALEQGLLHGGEGKGNRLGLAHGPMPSGKARGDPRASYCMPPMEIG